MGISSQSIPPDVLKQIGNDMVAGYGGFPLIGTKEKSSTTSGCWPKTASTASC